MNNYKYKKEQQSFYKAVEKAFPEGSVRRTSQCYMNLSWSKILIYYKDLYFSIIRHKHYSSGERRYRAEIYDIIKEDWVSEINYLEVGTRKEAIELIKNEINKMEA